MSIAGAELMTRFGELDWRKVRDDFPILNQKIGDHQLIYLDNAATSQKPREVIDAMVRFYERDNSNVHRGIHTLSNRATASFEAARTRLASYLNVDEECTIFTRGTTEAINLVARTWGDANLAAGDGILLTEMEHHSNLVPWQMLARRSGANLKFVPIDGNGLLALDDFEALLNNTKIFVFPHISNTLGTINPAAELCAKASQAGVVTLVDAAQSAGHMPVDFQDIGCDFLVFSGHKMCGPTGIGILAARREILDAMPPFHGGGEMISSSHYETSEYKETPYKFEAGTPPIAEAIGLGAATDYIEKIGRENIFLQDECLIEAALDELLAIPGLKIMGPKTGRAALASFTIEGIHAHDIVSIADEYGLALRGGHHCTQPLHRMLGITSSARASFYFYNTLEEVRSMGKILRKIRDILA